MVVGADAGGEEDLELLDVEHDVVEDEEEDDDEEDDDEDEEGEDPQSSEQRGILFNSPNGVQSFD